MESIDTIRPVGSGGGTGWLSCSRDDGLDLRDLVLLRLERENILVRLFFFLSADLSGVNLGTISNGSWSVGAIAGSDVLPMPMIGTGVCYVLSEKWPP